MLLSPLEGSETHCFETRGEWEETAGIINSFIDPFINYLMECPERPWFEEVTEMTTGSYYQFLKVSKSVLSELIASWAWDQKAAIISKRTKAYQSQVWY